MDDFFGVIDSLQITPSQELAIFRKSSMIVTDFENYS